MLPPPSHLSLLLGILKPNKKNKKIFSLLWKGIKSARVLAFNQPCSFPSLTAAVKSHPQKYCRSWEPQNPFAYTVVGIEHLFLKSAIPKFECSVHTYSKMSSGPKSKLNSAWHPSSVTHCNVVMDLCSPWILAILVFISLTCISRSLITFSPKICS